MNEIPFQLLPGPEPLVSWLHTDGARYTEPYFDESLHRLKSRPENQPDRRRITPLETLATCEGREPDAIIFHISRCGSTLLAQMLAALPHHTVLAEPPLVDAIIRLPRTAPRTTDDQRLAWLRGAVAALARPHAARARRLFVKLDCWHLFDWPLVRRAFPRTPLLFVHRNPVEVLASLLSRPSLTLVRDTVLPEQIGLTRAERDALTPTEHAAVIVGAFFRLATEAASELHPVAYEQMPDLVLHALPGVEFDSTERAVLIEASRRDAKNPARPFAPDAERKRREAGPAVWAAAERWALPRYHQFLATAARERRPIVTPATSD